MFKAELIIALVYVIALSPVSAHSSQEPNPQPQIIVKGEKFQGFQEYRLKRFKAQIKKLLDNYQGSDFKGYFNSLRKSYLKRPIKSISKEEKVNIFEELRDLYTVPELVETTDEMIAEMESMIKDQRLIGQEAGSVKIDPDKVKTLIVAPK